MSIKDKAKDRVKKNPTWLLGILLGAHLLYVSFNRVPDHPELWVFQMVLTSITYPIQAGLANGLAWIGNGIDTYFSFRDSRQENERLRAERTQIETRILEMQEKIGALEQVQALKAWETENKYQGIEARVVARDANRLFNTILIDKGSASGVIKDQPVVSGGALVGRVVNTWPLSSQVLMITDERHGAGAIIGQIIESRYLGVVKGKKDYICEMRLIAPPEKIENGEQVITSGQDGVYPKGLLIGRVKKTDGGSVVAPQVVEVEPAAALGKLELVSVLNIPPNRIRSPLEELTNEEKKQEKAPDRKKR